MTTIAYKDGIVAYDSRISSNGTIWDDDCDKHVEVDNIHYFLCGAGGGESDLIDWHINQKRESQMLSTHALVICGDQISTIGYEKKSGYYFNPERMGNPTAIGSGAICALTAMDLGCTAKEAVKMAIKRDTGTGGKIRTFKVK